MENENVTSGNEIVIDEQVYEEVKNDLTTIKDGYHTVNVTIAFEKTTFNFYKILKVNDDSIYKNLDICVGKFNELLDESCLKIDTIPELAESLDKKMEGEIKNE